jgi:hypothetical protein
MKLLPFLPSNFFVQQITSRVFDEQRWHTGLAIGISGLAGLFGTCLDVLEKFGSWREDDGSESRSLTARSKAHKLQLENCGQGHRN